MNREAASKRIKRALNAHKILRKEIAEGRIVPRPCEICGCDESEAHHDDYHKPLEVKWLCRSCHNKLHKNKKMRIGWNRPIPYRAPEEARDDPLGWVHRRGIGTVLKCARPTNRKRTTARVSVESVEGYRLWYDHGALRRAWEEFARVVILNAPRKYTARYEHPVEVRK